MNEFGVIARYFDRPVHRATLGIGDDCALLAPSPGHVLAVSTDMLVAGRHFFDDVDPMALGWKALAVNLSDLAAMGAKPSAFTLALAMPEVDEAWLEGFASGLFGCATAFDCELVGGDTTRGPLNLCVTIFGEVPEGAAFRRSDARAGDDVWVSGTVGDAALALRLIRDGVACDDELRRALERPTPRVALGLALRGIAHACIDVSDGLAQDLGHVLRASACGASLRPDALPLSDRLRAAPAADRMRCALAGGDDYELCFAAPVEARDAVFAAGRASATPVTRIGTIVAGSGLRLVDADGADCVLPDGLDLAGFDHFA